MKKVLMFILAMVMACGVAKAQLYGSDVYYYIPTGQSITNSTSVYVIYFDGRRCFAHEERRSTIVNKLNEDSRYYINYAKRTLENPDNGINYNASMSTSSRVVYQSEWYGSASFNYDPFSGSGNWNQPVLGYYYKAFSKDKSSMIGWRERKNSGSVESKTYYKQVDVKDLLPKAANHDFLYE